jgi:hypothetical protein
METSLKCWFYQCPKSKCGLVAVVNNIVLEHRYSNGIIPCPRCDQSMKRIREAQPGEYDIEMQEAFAAWETLTFEFRLVSPSEAFADASLRKGAAKVPHAANEPDPQISNLHKTASADVEKTPKFMSEADVAGILGISVRAVRRLVRDKKLRPIMLTKRKKVFTRAVVDDFIQRETGLFSLDPNGHHSASNLHRPEKRPIPLEESRSLLKDLRKGIPKDEEWKSSSIGSRR